MESRFNVQKKMNTNRKNKLKYFALTICIVAMLGMSQKDKIEKIYQPDKETSAYPVVNDKRKKAEARADFDKLMNEYFKKEISGNTIDLNYSVKNKDKYGLGNVPVSLGPVSSDEIKNEALNYENIIASLETFDMRKLTKSQQLTYKIAYKYYRERLKSANYTEYGEYLSPSNGIQSQLPIYFAEYNFYTRKDVENYIKMLNMVPEYFNKVIEYEKYKSESGTFMSDEMAQNIILQCQNFAKNKENNYLIKIFDDRIKYLNFLDENTKKSFIQQNKKAVISNVIPAYNNLAAGLKGLLGTGKNDGGLCHFKKGKKYYSFLVKTQTGSDKSVEKINKLLDDNISILRDKISDEMKSNPSAYYDASDVEYSCNTPEKSLAYLKKVIVKDFPEIPQDIKCTFKMVDSSLQDSLSPAFYLVPPIDDYKNNVVYINNSPKYDLTRAFTTIGHETYPGHLYQNSYFMSKNPASIRSVFHIGGYVEGYGTYAEIYSYTHGGLKRDVAEFLKNNALLTLCVYGKADIGVNYLGWSYKKLNDYLSGFGFSKENSRSIFEAMVGEPATYVKYTLGYYEIEALKNKAEEKCGKKFVLKDFHKFLLDVGPAQFSVIEEELNDWIKNKEHGNNVQKN